MVRGPTARGGNIFIPRRTFTRCDDTAQMGEIAYVAERQREAIAFIREDYVRFMGLNVKRFIYYWGGVPRSSEIPGLGSYQELGVSGILCARVLGPGACAS